MQRNCAIAQLAQFTQLAKLANYFAQRPPLPYGQGTSERIGRILNEAGVKVAMKPVKTISNILTSPKDPIAEHEKSRLVFEIPCADCEFVYVGQTKRDLKSRVAEHKRSVKNAEPEKSALCEHLMWFDHRINWEKSTVKIC